ncbi:MAG: hypothetical protein FWF43_02160 [Propionibacteriaceae bacterium]|nr:hypothetical protein [Propionibacteriaceae bacterium]
MSLLVGGFALVIGMLIASLVVSYVMAFHQAREAADLAAVTAAGQAAQSATDGRACAMAASISRDNRAEMTSCEIVRVGSDVAAEVEVTVGLHWTVPGLPGAVTSVSYAGNLQ